MESRRDENQFALSVKGRWLSYMLKCIVVVSAFTGIILSAGAGKGSFMGSTKVFMYFTIQSNIAIALICAIGFALLVRGRRIGRSWFTFKFVGTVSITLTGVVFCLLLAPVLGPYAWNLQNVLISWKSSTSSKLWASALKESANAFTAFEYSASVLRGFAWQDITNAFAKASENVFSFLNFALLICIWKSMLMTK